MNIELIKTGTSALYFDCMFISLLMKNAGGDNKRCQTPWNWVWLILLHSRSIWSLLLLLKVPYFIVLGQNCLSCNNLPIIDQRLTRKRHRENLKRIIKKLLVSVMLPFCVVEVPVMVTFLKNFDHPFLPPMLLPLCGPLPYPHLTTEIKILIV